MGYNFYLINRISKKKEYLNKKQKRYENEGESITEEIRKNTINS